MSLESISFETWQAIVSRRDHQDLPEFPEEIAYAMFEASRLQYLAAHRSEMNHMGFRLDGEPCEEPIKYELVSETDARAYSRKAQELATQVKNYIDSNYLPPENQSDYDERVGHYCFDPFSNLVENQIAIVSSGANFPPRKIPEDAVEFHVPNSVSKCLFHEFKNGMNAARTQLSNIANEMIPGRADAEELRCNFMEAEIARRGQGDEPVASRG